jgi:hypothetical protein
MQALNTSACHTKVTLCTSNKDLAAILGKSTWIQSIPGVPYLPFRRQEYTSSASRQFANEWLGQNETVRLVQQAICLHHDQGVPGRASSTATLLALLILSLVVSGSGQPGSV